jgi:hypothetical protein
MATFLDLQNGFYNAFIQGLGFSQSDPVQVVQPSTPLSTGSQGNLLLWNYLNNIPPFSLTQNYISSGGNQFGSDYSGLLSALNAAPNSFKADVGEQCYADWQAYVKTISPPPSVSNLPMTFRSWAMINGYQSVATIGASDLAKMLLDPISNAQMSDIMYKPSGANDINWVPGITTLQSELASAPSRKFTVNSSSMNSNVSSSWTQGSNSGFFGLWGSSNYQSSISQQFASSNISVSASFAHVLQFAATPGDWYNSSAMATAYNNPNDPKLWNTQSPITWKSTFDPNSGNMPRFATSLVVVDTMNVTVTSDAKFSQNDQQTIHNNSGAGMWPFYTTGGSSGSNTNVTFNQDGSMTVLITSLPTVPIVVALTVIPVDKFLGHQAK